MADDPHANSKGFVIRDRRLFDESGDVRPNVEKEEAPRVTGNQILGGAAAATSSNTGNRAAGKREKPKPPAGLSIDFPTFLMSLAGSAQVHLGLIGDPESGRAQPNLTAAKQTIDMLELLRTKTDGNLETDEERLLTQLLYELQMAYVHLSEKSAARK